MTHQTNICRQINLDPPRPLLPEILNAGGAGDVADVDDQRMRLWLREGKVRGTQGPGSNRWIIGCIDLLEDLKRVNLDQP